jgi:hypothetical protein
MRTVHSERICRLKVEAGVCAVGDSDSSGFGFIREFGHIICNTLCLEPSPAVPTRGSQNVKGGLIMSIIAMVDDERAS